MNKTYCKDNKKDRFIGNYLLPYLLKRIKDSEEPEVTIDNVASMYIFPYITADGIKIGSIKEPGTSWYYAKSDEEKLISTGSYRIFASNVIKEEEARTFRHLFGEYAYIAEFSDIVVVNDMIREMSKETDYSSRWWSLAYDVLKLWDPQKIQGSLSDATSKIDNNYFLFLDEYCDSDLRERLIKYGVFRDVLTLDARELFWNRLQNNEKDKAISMLRSMGVPHSFIQRRKEQSDFFSTYSYKECVSKAILLFIENLGKSVVYPVVTEKNNSERCELCHKIIFERIKKESDAAFNELISDEKYIKGIPVKNMDREFVPLSWDLFYLDSDFGDETSDEKPTSAWTQNEDQENDEIEIGHIEFIGEFERLHIDCRAYGRNFIERQNRIHEFSFVNNTFDDYYFGIDGEAENFYKWIWNYSHHKKLIENILLHYSGDEYERSTVPEIDNCFVIEVLKECDEDQGYCFDIDLQSADAFVAVDTLNKVSFTFGNINAVVYGANMHFDAQAIIPQIVSASVTDAQVKKSIATDAIWDHVYLTSGENGKYDSIYLHAYRYDEDEYKDTLILWPSTDQNSYVRALAKYVRDKYEISVSIADEGAFDWKNEYMRLIKDIRSFVAENRKVIPLNEIIGYTAETADIKSFGEEKKIWLKLKEQREKVLSHNKEGYPVNLDGWKDFLSAKYRGRCQLCGGKIPRGEQESYFWTFRMVKESRNLLANMRSNLFCLCPACHGEMQYGSIMGKDMSQIIEKARMYVEYLEKNLDNIEYEDHFPSLIQELVDEDVEIEGFHKPILCDVIVNGKERRMAFSWEHFMRIALIFSSINDFEGEEIKEYDNAFVNHDRDSYNGSFEGWHGTEYVSGHWRNRNGQDEWVRGHWRNR